MRHYRVTFFKKSEDSKKKEKFELLGSVVVDDHGTGRELTLAGKAFRHATARCQDADRLRFDRVWEGVS